MNSKQIAKLQHELMINLGYEKYVVQGGDWGSTVSKWMAELYPENCIGIHLNLVIAYPPEGDDPMEGVTSAELKMLENYEKYKTQGYGYYEIQKTKPQTIGYGLNDSPIGLAAWISEKYYGWLYLCIGSPNPSPPQQDFIKKMVILDSLLITLISQWLEQYSNAILCCHQEHGLKKFMM